MEHWRGKIAVVTGASAGIGADIALTLAQHGMKVVGLARRAHLVDELKSKVSGDGGIVSRKCDVADPVAVEETFNWIEENLGQIHVLVNNAAVLYHGHMTDVGTNPLSDAEIMSEIDVNVRGAILCTRRAVTSMKKHGVDGHIVNINSIAGHYVPSFTILNVYPSTKHAITAFTQSLNNELIEFGYKIKTTSISPGLVATEMAQMTRMPELRELVASLPVLQPRDVASAVVYALSSPPHVNISEICLSAVGEKRL